MNPINNTSITPKTLHDTEFEENGTAKRVATEALQAAANAQQEVRPLSTISASIATPMEDDSLDLLAKQILELIKKKDFVQAKELIRANPRIYEWKNSNGITVLFLFSHFSQWDFVKEMVKHPSCNVNATCASGPCAGMTPLWMAARNKQWDVVKEMLKLPGCNVNATPTSGPDAGKTPLLFAAANHKWDIVMEMLKLPGCNVNATCASGLSAGMTPLLFAAANQQWDIVKEMLKLPSCNVNAAPVSGLSVGMTPLWWAASHLQWDVVKEMLKLPGCNVNTAPVSGPAVGRTPLWLAASNQQWDVVKEMLKLPGCNVHTFPVEGLYAKKTILSFVPPDRKALYWHLLLMDATVNEIQPSDKVLIARIESDKKLLEQSFRKVSTLFDEDDDQTTSPFAMLPSELTWSIAQEALYAMESGLRNVPIQVINEKIASTRAQIALEKKEKAFAAFCASAYRMWKVEILGLSEPNHLKYSDLKRLFSECFAKTGEIKLNREARKQLLNGFRNIERPLTEAKVLKLLEDYHYSNSVKWKY